MLSILENDVIKVVVDTQGAEMKSLKLKKDNQEYVWQGDPKFWGRQTPVLFPIVGKLKDDQYQVDNKTYKMTQHGFARDSELEIVKKESDLIMYRLSCSEESLKKYPYRFEFDILYRLEENKVVIEYTVRNIDKDRIYFSLGTHPAFNWPLEDGESKEDCYLEFEKEEELSTYLLEDGLLSINKIEFLNNSKIKNLFPELFKDGALIFKELKSEKIALKSHKSNREVLVEFDGFPYLVIWSQSAESPFICIEPWYGISDSKDSTGNFKEKEGIESLDKGEEFFCKYSISIK